jgi:hypothetical protein
MWGSIGRVVGMEMEILMYRDGVRWGSSVMSLCFEMFGNKTAKGLNWGVSIV